MLAATLAAAPAHGQDYPSKPIRMLVPAQAGGIGDILPRILGQKLGDDRRAPRSWSRTAPPAPAWSRPRRSPSAPPDGYLLLMGNQGQLAIRPHLAKLPYDPIKDFAPVVLMVTVPNILVVHPSVPAQTLHELIAYAKANPGKLSYASQGIGASGHIAGELFKQAAGVDITHVPYRGAAPAAQDLAAGHVSMMFDVVSLALGPIQSGTVRALGVAAKERVAVLPDVPTLGRGRPRHGGRRLVRAAGAGRHAARRHRLAEPGGQQARSPRPMRASASSRRAPPCRSARRRSSAISSPTQTARFGEVIRRAGIKEE